MLLVAEGLLSLAGFNGLVVAVAGCQLGRSRRGDPVLEEPAGERCAALFLLGDDAVLVRLGRQRSRRLESYELVALVLVKRSVNLNELTVRKAHDTSGFTSVQGDLTVLPLQRPGVRPTRNYASGYRNA